MFLIIYGCKKETSNPTQNETRLTYDEIVDIIASVDAEFSSQIETLGIYKAKESIELLLLNNPNVTHHNFSPDSAVIFWVLSDSTLCSYTMNSFGDLPDTLRYDNNTGSNNKFTMVNTMPHNNKALLLSPHYWYWANPLLPPEKDDLNYYFNSKLEVNGYDVTYIYNENKSDQNITLEDYLNWDNYGVISFVGHGAVNGIYFTINSGVNYTFDLYNQYKNEFLFTKELGVNGKYDANSTLKEQIFVTSHWFEKKYAAKLDNTFILMSACESLHSSVQEGFDFYLLGDNSVYWGWDRSYYPRLGGFMNGRNMIDYLLGNKLNCCEANDIMGQNGENYHQFINTWPWPKIYLKMSDDSDCDFLLVENGGSTNTFTDPRDGQVYNIVTIGNQIWFAENLNIGTRIDGSQGMENNSNIEKYCYNDDDANCDTHGGLYLWNELMQYNTQEGSQGICPDGWHIPTDEEFKQLEGEVDLVYNYPDPEWDELGMRGYNAGENLRSGDWNNGTNTAGFSALPAGWRHFTGVFYQLGEHGKFWTSSEKSSSDAWWRSMEGGSRVRRGGEFKGHGGSVRCLKN